MKTKALFWSLPEASHGGADAFLGQTPSNGIFREKFTPSLIVDKLTDLGIWFNIWSNQKLMPLCLFLFPVFHNPTVGFSRFHCQLSVGQLSVE